MQLAGTVQQSARLEGPALLLLRLASQLLLRLLLTSA